MKTFLRCIMTAIAVISAILSTNAAENVVKKNLNVSSFNEIEASSAINVVYTQTNGDFSAAVEMNKKDENYFIFEQKGSKIIAKRKQKKHNWNTKSITLYISAPYLVDIELSGASSFKADKINQLNKNLDIDCSGASSFKVNTINANNFSIDCSGASSASLSVNAKKIEVDCSGASKVAISGTANLAEYDASGASSISAADLKANKGEVEASGASNVTCSIQNLYRRVSSGASKITNK
ncbi:MAG: GIN domain-containing protein [Muribaculaceae bacterium]